MTDADLTALFLYPQDPKQRQYEALRARFVDREPYAVIADRFGLSPGTLRNLAAELRKTRQVRPFATPATPAQSARERRNARIIELRRTLGLSNVEIARWLKAENLTAGSTTIGSVLREAGFPKLPRRTARARPRTAATADVRQFKVASGRLSTQFGGLFLFARDLAQARLEAPLAHWPTSQKVPPGPMVRALLALKLWGIGRPYRVMPDILDEGCALFAGLNAMPKKSTLSEYSTRVDKAHLVTLMDLWHQVTQQLLPEPGDTFDLDFHTIPYHGDEALLQKHFVSKRSRRQRGVLALVARNARQHMLVYGDTTITKQGQNDAILDFIEQWKQRTGQLPKELVFDSRFTTYANLAKLNALDIYFLTLRRRAPSIIARLNRLPPGDWKKIQLNNIGRKYRTPRIMDEVITLRHYPHPVRQLAIRDLGHDKPTLLITNRMHERAADLVDRYARRMLIENAIEDAIDFFHMDALSSTVPLRIDLDLQLTLIASTLYRKLAHRLGGPYTTAKARTLFNHFVKAPATVITNTNQVVIRLGRRAHNNMLRAAGYLGSQGHIPWLHGRELIIDYT